MRTKERAAAVIAVLKAEYPDAVCTLKYDKPYELLFAARLSAQCTDERVNQITPVLFAAYPTLESFANAELAALETLVYSCGFYRHKARDILLCAGKLLSDFDGRVPDTIEALLTLPGVGRKTANLILGDIYHKPAVVCDTHCIRICGKLGLTDGTRNPEKAERQLWGILPAAETSDFCHRIVLHGRAVCTARAPQCGGCALKPTCKYGAQSVFHTPSSQNNPKVEKTSFATS